MDAHQRKVKFENLPIRNARKNSEAAKCGLKTMHKPAQEFGLVFLSLQNYMMDNSYFETVTVTGVLHGNRTISNGND